jgi:hypothetical protein
VTIGRTALHKARWASMRCFRTGRSRDYVSLAAALWDGVCGYLR